MSLSRFLLNSTRRSATDLDDILRPDAGDDRASVRRIADYFRRMAGNAEAGMLTVNLGDTAAAATLTFTNDPSADETFTLCNVVLTAKASGASGEEEWNITSGGTNAADAAGNAASVAALINGHSVLSLFLSAVSVLGVVTITCLSPGKVGNGLQISDTLTNATSAAFSGGAEGAQTVLSLV